MEVTNHDHPLNNPSLSLEERLIYIVQHRTEESQEIRACNFAYAHYKGFMERDSRHEAIDPLLLMMRGAQQQPMVLLTTPSAERRLEEAEAMYNFISRAVAKEPETLFPNLAKLIGG